MKKNDLHKKTIDELNSMLLKLLREQFNLRMQTISGQFQQTHLVKKVRRNIARVRTLLTQKAGA